MLTDVFIEREDLDLWAVHNLARPYAKSDSRYAYEY